MAIPATLATRPCVDASDAGLEAELARRLRQAVVDALVGLGGAGAEGRDGHHPHAALTVPQAPSPLAPARLAAAHPGGETARRQAERIYERCLVHYRGALRPGDARPGVDDAGAAMAHFVAANLQALHDVVATPPALRRLQGQLAGVVQASAVWMRGTLRERQLHVETLATLAVYVDAAAKQAPSQGRAAVDNVRRAARGYLFDLLGLDPDGLTLDERGLVPRESAAVASLAAATPTATATAAG